MFTQIREMFIGLLNNLTESFDNQEAVIYWFQSGVQFVILVLTPFLLVLFVGALAINFYQVGFEPSTESLVPKWKNLNIADPENYKKFFNLSALMRLVFGISKLSVIGIVSFVIIYAGMKSNSRLMDSTTSVMFVFLFEQAFFIGIYIAGILIVLGIFDFLYQKWKFSNDMKMTKQEVKDERKQTEGDMQMKSKLRSMMQSFIQNRMKSNVQHADVVVANPIHFAVAIKYDAKKMAAPICIAKGARKVAIEIKERAKKYKIPVVENPPLARALYKVVDVGVYVPPDFYHSVAEVLAFVYRMNQEVGSKQR